MRRGQTLAVVLLVGGVVLLVAVGVFLYEKGKVDGRAGKGATHFAARKRAEAQQEYRAQ